jgi:hypothetical protein
MKRVILLLVVAWCSSANVFSKTESEENDGFVNAFEADSAVWSYLFGGNSGQKIYQMKLFGDTIIDNTKWKYVTDGFVGKILVRTEGKKVIAKGLPDSYSIHFSEEIIIYDFALNVGDSVLASYGSGYHIKDEIIGIDSIVLNDIRKHKRINLRYESHLIEGIGCVSGPQSHPLFMFIGGTIGTTIGPNFVCCEVNGELLYKSPLYVDCDGTPVNNETVSYLSPKASIFFAGGQLRVTFDDETPFDVKLYNMQGMMLLQSKNNRNEMLVNLEHLSKGVYAVRVNSGNYVYSDKIVK